MAPLLGSEIEQLVLQLYQPGNPTQIKQIEKHLQELQRSPQGWEMADYLLGCDGSTTRFFGALTFQIKLNTSSAELDDDALAGVGQRLIFWFNTAVARGDNQSVLRKLCAALSTFMTLPREVGPGNWLTRAFLATVHNQEIDINATDLPLPTFETLPSAKIRPLLWLLTSYAEEVSKQSSLEAYRASAGLVSLSEKASASLPVAVRLMRACFDTRIVLDGAQDDYQLQLSALATEVTWLGLCQRMAWLNDPELRNPLTTLMDVTLEWFKDITIDEAVTNIADVLSTFGMFFTPGHLQVIEGMLIGPWGQECVQIVQSEAQEDVPPPVNLFLVYGAEKLQALLEKIEDPIPTQIIDSMHKMLQSPGFAGVDDSVAPLVLDFWDQLVTEVADAEFDDTEEPKAWMPAALDHMMQAFHELWIKIRLPTKEQYAELDKDRTKVFRQFRIDVKELLLAAYPSLRSRMTEVIVKLCAEALSKQDWLEVEASLFCLHSISIAEQLSEDQLLSQLFGSSLFVQLKADQAVPPRVRATGVDLLGQYAEFFERHTEFLPAVLDFLFGVFNSLSDASLAHKASKAINRLCSSCRSSLRAELPNFVQAYEQFLSSPVAEGSTQKDIIGAVAAIVQSLPSLEEQVSWLDTLLQYVQRDVDGARRKFSEGLVEEAQVSCHAALRCLAAMGKASQAPNDEPLEPEVESAMRHFWSEGPGQAIQQRIFSLIATILEFINQSLQPLELHGDLLEAVSGIFKSGFAETTPGPFVFAASAFVDFFSTVQLSTPRLELILGTACAYLRSHSHANTPDIVPEATRLLSEVMRLISQIQDLREEDNTTGLMEVLERFMPRYTGIFFSIPQQELEQLFSFPLQCLSLPEPLPKRQAAQFWATFFALKPARAKVSQEHLDDVINHFGPRLALELVRNISGAATRTDLDWFAEPVKKFLTRTIHTKRFMEQALAEVNVGENVGPQAKSLLLKQLAVANGVGTVKKVITSYWSQCRGLPGEWAPR